MKSVEIITAQNVVLQYELAGLKDRVLAFMLDIIALTVGLSILSAIGYSAVGNTETGSTVVSMILILAFIFYSLAFETLNKGRSLGKMALRIQVIRLAGGHATFSDYVARWVFRLIDIYCSMGAIASILVVSSSRGQRIGDVVANTAVVKTVPQMNLNLSDLLAIHQRTNYTPKYQQARKLSEEDALVIKRSIDQFRRYNNDGHQEAIHLLADKIKSTLDIEAEEQDELRFIQTVLQDYVVLSR